MNHDYIYSTPDYESTAAGIGFSVMAVVFLIMLVSSAIPLIIYIIRALALYRLASRRGVSSPILAWIPVADAFLIGKLTEEVEARRTGHSKSWAKTTLITSIIGSGGFGLTYVLLVVMIVVIGISEANFEAASIGIMMVFIVTYIFLMVSAMLAYAAYILRSICEFKLFEDVLPEKALLYTVLSVAVPFAEPILLFKIKELGYEKPAPAYNYAYTGAPAYPPNAQGFCPPAGMQQPPQYQPPQYQPPQYQPPQQPDIHLMQMQEQQLQQTQQQVQQQTVIPPETENGSRM